jgi:SagB-type dehydrogenase family enzyme
LKIAQDLKDLRTQAFDLAELGALGLAEGALNDAVRCYREALALFQKLRNRAMEAVTWNELGRVFQKSHRADEAERHFREAACIDQHADRAESCAEAASFPETALYEDLTTDYIFDPDLLIDGQREARIIRWSQNADRLGADVRPMLVPGVRTYVDDQRAVRFCLPAGEPAVERQPDCTVMRRTRREVAISGSSALVWRLIQAMDGSATVAEILSTLHASDQGQAADLLATLAATGAVDVSGRAIARFLHARTQKGVMPGGGLQGDDVRKLVTDGNYRAYPEAPRVAVGPSTPDRLRAFHALTRSRRSYRDYLGLALSRGEFDALLHTACGVTGAMPWDGRQVPLRAYPSSGALYAVEIYPVVFRVEGLQTAVYHYRAIENVLELVRPDIDLTQICAATLPLERQMVAGVAAMICLVGLFPRHERKYGEGGYRMLVAEAGHISQSLILAATALGLSARPFGGVFDDLLNQDLGLQTDREQFLLAVLVGHSGVKQGGDTAS